MKVIIQKRRKVVSRLADTECKISQVLKYCQYSMFTIFHNITLLAEMEHTF